MVTLEGIWCSDSSMLRDIVIAYSGMPQRQFFLTQVGNFFFFVFLRGWKFNKTLSLMGCIFLCPTKKCKSVMDICTVSEEVISTYLLI